jgi:ABC-type multidrug transport system permease subunit
MGRKRKLNRKKYNNPSFLTYELNIYDNLAVWKFSASHYMTNFVRSTKLVIFVEAKAKHVYWKKKVSCSGTMWVKILLLLEKLLVRTNRETPRHRTHLRTDIIISFSHYYLLLSFLFASLCYFLITRLMFFYILVMFLFLLCMPFFSILLIPRFCIVLCIVSSFVYSCLFTNFLQVYWPLPPGGNSIAVNKYHIIITVP